MSLLLSFYTDLAHLDVLLPVTNNADFSVELPAEHFGGSHSVKLLMEVLDNQWRFKKNTSYSVEKNGERWEGKTIKGGDFFTVFAGPLGFSLIVQSLSCRMGSFEKFSIQRLRELSIGKDPNCDICYQGMNIISRHHISVYWKSGGAMVEDFSSNGTFLNGKRLSPGRKSLRFGDIISIYGMKLICLGDTIAVNLRDCGAVSHQRLEEARIYQDIQPISDIQEPGESESLFHRAPRKLPSLYTEPEEIEAPPQKQNSNRKPVWMIVGPSFTMAIPMLLGCGFMIAARNLTGLGGSVFMYVGLVTALSSAIIGIAWALINLNYSQKEEKENELLRLQKYGDYLIECARRICEKYEHNRSVLLEMYPDAETCCQYWHNTTELWGRNRSHGDFMCYRLGLGDIPFQVPITIPKKRFTLIEDELSERPWEIQQNYATLHQVPIYVDLFLHRVVGIVGRRRKEISRLLLTQIAANNCYTDVRVVILASSESSSGWAFAKWLPHVWNTEHSMRFVAFGQQEVSGVCYELTQILRARSEEAEISPQRQRVLPTQYVVFVENVSLLEAEPVTKYLLDQPQEIGVTTLLLAGTYEDLPNSCDFILEYGQDFSGMYSMAQDGEKPQKINFDTVPAESSERLARKISGIRVVEVGGGSDLPDSLTFFEMLGIHSLSELPVEDNWRKNRTYETMQAIIGWKVGGMPCYLNIHERYHGPHGLIAGTTGSGKSETLQTYILSLAILFSPQDVGFFIIDFKGGGMANLFQGLPHLLGTISNLSGAQVRRAMVSIKSENLRRQRIFSEYDVNHIDAYTKLVKNGEATVPIPHLFIIIDEFAELKREQPEFMQELISVAQVGRSLGVHLILATQKPSGTVDDNIWSNTKFRLCLRVADKQDSKDMLHKPDAAYLTQAGRCYLQVGNDELYELFQSGWSGAVYDEDMEDSKNSCAVQLENSGKAVLTGGSAKARKSRQKKERWLRELIECCQETIKEQRDAAKTMNALFARLEQRKLGYPDGAYNRRQLREFMECFAEYIAAGPDAAGALLKEAERLGKKLPEQKERTQLDAVVDYLSHIADVTDSRMHLKLWMPVLPEQLMLRPLQDELKARLLDEEWNLPQRSASLQAIVGLVDDPQHQTQFPLVLDFLQDGHLAVCGAVSSGKSTLLQTIVFALAERYTPDMLNFYMVDYSSQMLAPFEALPHTGGVVYEGQTEKLSKLFLLMSRILAERKNLFRGGSFLQYIQVHGNVSPAILLVIDGYSSFREKTENAYEEKLLELARDGAGFGIFLCISAGGFGTGEIQSKIGDKLRQVLCLEMDSKYSYGECLRTMRFDVLPESGVRGRGLAQCGDSILEYQTALAAEGDDYHRGETLLARCQMIAELWHGKSAQAIPEIPQNPMWEDFLQLEVYQTLVHSRRFLPLGYRQQDSSIYSVDLAKTYCYLISGRERSGKSVFLRNIACAARDTGGRLYLVDRIGQTTEKHTANLTGATYINTSDGLFSLWKMLILTINDRHIRQKELREQGIEDIEIFEKMSEYEQIFVLIADLPDFIENCARPGGGKASMSPQVENVIEKGAQHQVYFFGICSVQDQITASAQLIYRSFIRDRHGVHLGGMLSNQKLLSYRNVPFAEQGRSRRPGSGYVPNQEDDMSVDEIVIPMNKGMHEQVQSEGNAT